jgi:hypothetical protein
VRVGSQSGGGPLHLSNGDQSLGGGERETELSGALAEVCSEQRASNDYQRQGHHLDRQIDDVAVAPRRDVRARGLLHECRESRNGPPVEPWLHQPPVDRVQRRLAAHQTLTQQFLPYGQAAGLVIVAGVADQHVPDVVRVGDEVRPVPERQKHRIAVLSMERQQIVGQAPPRPRRVPQNPEPGRPRRLTSIRHGWGGAAGPTVARRTGA